MHQSDPLTKKFRHMKNTLQQAGLRRRLTTEAVFDLFNTWSVDGAAVSVVIKESRPSSNGALDPMSAGILPSVETVLELVYSRGTDYCLR
ncbi:hypothetical protein BpHYR1_043204 [Brachionus plicatilis]|uniref:Uncharacterized protein n=1 Tax=Brachionus plicatilis TaxID=10195 RepID=A0A3M7RAD1_BRAPC|nr:hypothetical protein BpHYR1_043204 [Brachionus plicatilis]